MLWRLWEQLSGESAGQFGSDCWTRPHILMARSAGESSLRPFFLLFCLQTGPLWLAFNKPLHHPKQQRGPSGPLGEKRTFAEVNPSCSWPCEERTQVSSDHPPVPIAASYQAFRGWSCLCRAAVGLLYRCCPGIMDVAITPLAQRV